MPSQQLMEVRKGDFGTRYHLIEGQGGGFNRPVNNRRVREYGRNIMALGISGITLIRKTATTYYIADGQHRIKAISDYGNGKPVMMPATIYTAAEIEATGRSIPQFISDLNRGRAFTAVDRIAVFAGQSAWPTIFASYGLNPENVSSRAGKLHWGAILRAHLFAMDSRRNGRICYEGTSRKNREALEEIWQNADLEAITKTAKALQWWAPIAERVRLSRNMNSLYSTPAILVAILLYEQNAAIRDGDKWKKDTWAKIGSRIEGDPALPELRGLQFRRFTWALLRSINYKLTTNRLLVFGQDGREEA